MAILFPQYEGEECVCIKVGLSSSLSYYDDCEMANFWSSTEVGKDFIIVSKLTGVGVLNGHFSVCPLPQPPSHPTPTSGIHERKNPESRSEFFVPLMCVDYVHTVIFSIVLISKYCINTVGINEVRMTNKKSGGGTEVGRLQR